MNEKIIGILGGMGPEATVDLFSKVLQCDPAETDQDHVRIIIDCNSKIPDRTNAYYGKGPDPAEELQKSARVLETAGCDLLIIPCNTAHLWYEKICEAVSIPVLHIMKASARRALDDIPGIRKAGLLGTLATYDSGIYDRAYEEAGVEMIHPCQEDMEETMRLIREVKKGIVTEEMRRSIQEIARRMIEAGAEGIVAGCTEIPLMLKNGDISVPVIDSTMALAQEAVDVAKGKKIL